MVADVGREPGPDPAGLHVTGGFQRGLVVSPPGIVPERHARKVVLGVKKISSDGFGDEKGNEQRKTQREPAKAIRDRPRDRQMQHEGDQAIVVLAGFVEEWIKTHPVKK